MRSRPMQLTLTSQETQSLRGILSSYLPGLRRELARTEIRSRELKHELVLREDLCEKLLTELEHADEMKPAATV